MAITEQKKQRLLDRLRRVLDPETAELLMEVTVPANVELASRSDIAALGGELRGEMRAGFAALEHRLYPRVLPIMTGLLGLVVTAATIIADRIG